MSRIQEQFPELFTTPRAGWVEINSGWEPLVTRALEKLRDSSYRDEAGVVQPQVLQVKEKFGGLRMYLSFHREEWEKVIQEAEKEASRTCEFCGAVSEDVRLRPVGWWKTLCDGCERQRRDTLGE